MARLFETFPRECVYLSLARGEVIRGIYRAVSLFVKMCQSD